MALTDVSGVNEVNSYGLDNRGSIPGWRRILYSRPCPDEGNLEMGTYTVDVERCKKGSRNGASLSEGAL